jgi:Tol biopolymer transport system component/predicted Ser/Thr protein kinase
VIGRTLLHYTITDKLGEGGMGVVYKATDTHLDRFIALKVLPPERVADEERKRRFIQEAKAASALSHPNIVHVYDIATDQDTTFIAMEYVSGKTLGELIPRQGLPLASVLNYGAQIADGLAQAHKAGIIHRDLKPGNVMVGDDGRVRILDFGLAKLGDRSIASENTIASTATYAVPPNTEAGLVLGTVAYMSPEQAEGRPVDRRTDVFSFGVLLYEMIAGTRPFGGDTSLAMLSAILRDAPTPIAERAAGVPPELARIVDRCLRKDPERRWQHMEDVRIALLDLKEESDSGRLVVPVAAAKAVASRANLVWASVATLAVVVAGGVAWSALRRPASRASAAAPSLQPVPLTSYEGDERDPAFSPDGNQIAFSWGPEGGVTNTYVKLVGPGNPIRLTQSEYTERQSQWSPDGRSICFNRNGPSQNVIIVVPALGGPERNLGSTTWRCTWSPDSQYVLIPDANALWLAPVSGGERRRMNLRLPKEAQDGRAPMGTISPDGRTLAFIVGSGGPMYLVPLGADYQPTGAPRRVTPVDWSMISWSWTPDSQSVIAIRSFGDANTGGDSAMYRIRVNGGELERLDFVGDNPWFLDVARTGHRLAFTRLRRDLNLYRVGLNADGTVAGRDQPVASSSRREQDAAISPDGSRIAFSSNRSGADEIWVADRAGNNLVQLTSSDNPSGTDWPAWSPDGTRIAYQSQPKGALATDVFVIPAAGGAAIRLTDAPEPDMRPAWSADGKWIYFTSQREGGGAWKVPAAGGPAVRVSNVRANVYRASPDGQWLFASGGGEVVTRIPLAGGQPQEVLRDVVSTGAMTSRGLYYLSQSTDLKSSTLKLLPLDGGMPRTLGVIPHTTTGGLSVSPDFTSIIYSRCDQCAADIMLVEGFQ